MRLNVPYTDDAHHDAGFLPCLSANMLAPGSSAWVNRPLTTVVDHHCRCRPHTMARGRRREREQSTHSTSISVGRNSAEEMAKLNSLTLLSCSGKLYIQLYPSNSSAQTCQAAILLQWLDVTAGLTLTSVSAVATVRQVSLSTPPPAAATAQQHGSPFGVCSCRAVQIRAADYLIILSIILLLTLEPLPCRSSSSTP